jgi:phosphatidylglycerophosphate synthase
MLDRYLRPIIDPPLIALARAVARTGATANTITAIGFAFALCGFVALAFQEYWIAIAFILLNRLMDGVDGPLARQSQATDLGGYLDIVSDFIFYSGTVLAFAIGQPDMALPAAVLIFSFIGTSSSFLAYAIVAAKRGITDEDQGQKSFFYLGGLTEGTESFFVLILICLLPNYFAWIAYTFAILCWLTTLGRVRQATNDFGDGQ